MNGSINFTVGGGGIFHVTCIDSLLQDRVRPDMTSTERTLCAKVQALCVVQYFSSFDHEISNCFLYEMSAVFAAARRNTSSFRSRTWAEYSRFYYFCTVAQFTATTSTTVSCLIASSLE